MLFGFGARLFYLVFAHSYRFSLTHWVRFEMANLAYSLATNQGFSSPFGGHTGPSAWTAPVYPWLISLAFRTFGSYSPAAAIAMLMFNSVFSVLTIWIIYRIADHVFGKAVAVRSAWVWALLPDCIYWSVTWVWDTSLAAFLLSALFLLTLEMEGKDRLSLWSGYGVLWGVAGLTSTSVLAWLPFSGCWLAYQLHRRGKPFLLCTTLSALIFWATLTPWLVRNYFAFGQLVFVRGNLGVELRSGNNAESEGDWVPVYHPTGNSFLYAQYKEMGEAAFVAEQARIAREWIGQHPNLFWRLSFRRCIFFWAGLPRQGLQEARNLVYLGTSVFAFGGLLLATTRRLHGVFLFATLLGFYPLVYYITFAASRYRHPIDPELVILAVFSISSILGSLAVPSLAGAKSRPHAFHKTSEDYVVE